MANKTMHHAVIGADTFELIDEAGREETSQLKNALDDSTYGTPISTNNFVGDYGYGALSNTNKYIIGIIPAGAKVTQLKQLVAANSTAYVKLELWEYNDSTKKYEQGNTITAYSCEADPDSANYILSFAPFSVSQKTLLTYADTSSSGWLKWKSATPYVKYFSAALTSVNESQFVTSNDMLAVKWTYAISLPKKNEESIIGLDSRITNAKDDIEYIFDSAYVKQDITKTSLHYPLILNNAYVWMRTAPIPKGAKFIINIFGEDSTKIGDVTVYFFEKNSNGTYTVVNHVDITTVVGDNPIIVPDDLTDDSDIYVGVYSEDNGIGYSTDGLYATSYTRCSIGDMSSDEITMSGNYTLEFSIAISYIKPKTLYEAVIVVDANGSGDYTSVLSAIENEPEGTVIFVKPGVYEQDMTDCLKKRVILIGSDRNQCIIRDTDGRYGHHPLYVSCGYFENLTIEAPYVSGTSHEIGVSDLGAYAVHIDTDDDYAIGKTCEFHHCTLKSDFFPAVGIGMRKDATYIFDDCELANEQVTNRGDYSDEGTLGALYFHDSNGEQGDQYIKVKNCVLKSKLAYAMCPYQVSRNPQNNRVYCDFINNVLYSDVGKYSNTVWFRGDPFNTTTGIFSIGIGYGNSIASLNNN